jgi:formylglycine-generating enzyme required for sulfatase activity
LPKLARRAESSTDGVTKARFAVVALQLGDAKPAQQALAVGEDPRHRTAFIHGLAAWHGDLGAVAAQLAASDDGAFRSGVCAALGTIAPESMEPSERELAAKVLVAHYKEMPDGGTHAAAGWALRRWKRDIPVIEPTSRSPSDRRWFINRQGLTMIEVAAGKFTMGTTGETQFAEEKPAHEVTLTRAFYLADCEVTVEQFQRFNDDAEYAAAEKPQGWQDALAQWKQYSPTPDCPVTAVN